MKESDNNNPDVDRFSKARAEESIREGFHKKLMEPFTRACRDYELISEGDRIAVCISGGKDSMLMAKLFQEIQKHRKMNFELVFLTMDPGYNRENRELIERNAAAIGVPLTIFESGIFEEVDKTSKGGCYVCARMRRGHLYSKAKELGCNKIALGHHYDDVIETILMSMLYGGQIQTMMPKVKSRNYEGMELIRPMYLIREDDIVSWCECNGLEFLRCACSVMENAADPEATGRLKIKKLISELKKTNPAVEANIFRSVENIDIDAVISYKKDGKRRSFLDDY
ncbi:MAG: tRNA 2-thiocytidine biosynthesis protein TtcA [Clostridiales bacterium]|nr:tRNA 2-thiocytidine biosynthesis protein TtcA [Clostridiales bacterium]